MTKAKQGQGIVKKYIPVNVPDDETYQLYKTYSQLTGVPVSRAIRDAMKEYAEVILTTRLETLAEQVKAGKGVLRVHAPVADEKYERSLRLEVQH